MALTIIANGIRQRTPANKNKRKRAKKGLLSMLFYDSGILQPFQASQLL
jgi:hypothetical protein